MKKTDLLKLVEQLADDGDVNEIILGADEFKGLGSADLSKLTVDDFKKLITDNPSISGYNQSTLDSAISKAINSHDEKFKAEKLPNLLAEELKKISNEGKTPEQIKLEELQTQLNSMQKDKVKAELNSKYTKVLTEKGLPVDLVDYIIADGNEETINSNIEKFSGMFTSITDTKVNEKLNNNSYVPPSNSGGKILSGVEQAFYSRNPSLVQE